MLNSTTLSVWVTVYRFAKAPSSTTIGHPMIGLTVVAFLTTVIFILLS
jgi:hypothetical protein